MTCTRSDRVEAEEDLEALQEQTFTRVQHMQEQITGLVRRLLWSNLLAVQAPTKLARELAHAL